MMVEWSRMVARWIQCVDDGDMPRQVARPLKHWHTEINICQSVESLPD